MRIAIGGDISVKGEFSKYFKPEETKNLFGDVIDVMKSADRTVVNLECAITDSEAEIKKFGPCLKAPFGMGEVLKSAGATDCVLSNNHIFDFGKKGLADTIAELEKTGLNYTGVGKNDSDARRDLVIEKDGIKVRIIAVCEHEYSYALPDRVGTRVYDPYDTHDDIKEAKKDADFVVVIYHGGKEQCRYPSPRLLKACRSMVKCGADVVLCQHSHCIGCYEEYMGAHILYGQGNFLFPYSNLSEEGLDRWSTGLLVVLDFADGCKIEFVPTVLEGYGISLAKGDEKKRLLDELAARSATLSDGTWRDGWHEFCVKYTEQYSSMLNPEETDLFAHYLDCEAHSDVWRELYPTWNLTNEK